MARAKITKDNEEPFPAQQLLVLGLCRLTEPIAFISIVSYNFAMVADIKGPKNASFWAGVLVSAFAIAEACTAVVWGTLSDRFGRKPIILIGLSGTVISSLILGFAKSYWVALAARLIGGLLNGNVAVMQTMVAEMVKNPKHEPRAYSIQPFAWSLGSIAGSALGGYAAQPARFYPEYFSPDGLFGVYLIFCYLIGAGCITLAIIQASFFLKETRFDDDAQDTTSNGFAHHSTDERTPLMSERRRSSVADAFAKRTRRLSYVAGSAPIPNEPSFDMRKESFASAYGTAPLSGSTASEGSAISEEEDDNSSLASIVGEKIFTKPVVMWIGAISLLCYHQMSFVSVFPIFILDQPRRASGLDLIGGLGYTVHDVGKYMAVNSCASLFVQWFILPVFMARVGLWRSIVTLTAFAPCIDVLMPFLTALPNPGAAVYPAFMASAFCNIIIYPSLLIMLKNAAPSRKSLGRINGAAVSASSAARTIGPPLVGLFYGQLGSAGAWWSCALFGSFAFAELWFIKKPVSASSDAENGAIEANGEAA